MFALGIGLLLTRPLLRLVRRVLAVAALIAILVVLTRGHLAAATHLRFWQTELTQLQTAVQHAVQHSLRTTNHVRAR